MVIKKLKQVVSSILYKLNVIKLEFYGKYKRSKGVVNAQGEKLLIVSLTTYHKRISIVHVTIESLMNQSFRPNKIILWLSQEDLVNGHVPETLTRLTSRGLDIRVKGENIRSYKKLIYTLAEYPESIIITCDDDVIYPSFFIKKLYDKHHITPKHIVAYRCMVIRKSNDTNLSPYVTWKRPLEDTPSFELLPTGVAGILYPPDSLSDTVFNQELFLKLAPHGDDIWFKAMAILNKTKTSIVELGFNEFPFIEGSQDGALWHSNVLDNKNDEQLKNVFDYFDLYHFIS